MSFSLAWFAVQGIGRDDFLDRTGFTDTGEVDEYFEHDHSAGELPGGWYVIVTSELGMLAPDRLAQWSAGGRLVAALVHEEAANTLSTEWKDGRQVWSVSHDGGEGGDQLAVEGKLPDVFEELKHEAEAAQKESEKEGGGVNFVFDIPLDLAAEITGFRHDEMGFDDDIPPFTVLERTHVA
ncbi:MAG: hypothetical protein RIR33_1512 [Pseudomonadota bacterium]|jgi:hypothetical protein